jgi:ribonuclease-3
MGMAVRDSLEPPVHGDHLTSPPPAEAIFGHRFARPELLREALTHRSAAPSLRDGGAKGSGSNERLEFVGDRVLGLLIAEWLAERFPREQEGELGRRLAHLVSQPVLAAIAETSGLPAVLSVAPGESRAGVRQRATVLADAMEAVIGALFLDGGIAPARCFVRAAWERAMTEQAVPPKDAKTALQEWAQGRGHELPCYVVASRGGPPHEPVFVISVTVDGRTGTGTSGTKRAAEQQAAGDLLGQLLA